MRRKGNLIVIAGPTAVGKTSVAVELAKHYQTEILSADSRQFYREMQVGTARPTAKEMNGIPHHFTGHLYVTETYNVSTFEKEALSLLESLFQSYEDVIMAGGSGLYINAVCHGIDELPDPDPELRQRLQHDYETKGIEILREKLQQLDPEYYIEVDINNPKRLIRGIEVCLATGRKYSEMRTQTSTERPFNIIKIGLTLEREELFQRISKRTDKMIEEGLVDEVRSLYPYRDFNALNTVGYKEIFRYLDGEITLEQTIEDIKTNTRRYAKRQLTWFRKDPEITWFSPFDLQEIIKFIDTRK